VEPDAYFGASQAMSADDDEASVEEEELVAA